jgi:murein DD-endopeptidase MepM/ murein hydrolase activator NlpD
MKEPYDKKWRGDLFGNLAPYRNGQPHRGMDWKVPAGTIIPAIGEGLVRDIFFSEILGWTVEQQIGDIFVQYSHLQEKPKSLQMKMPIKQGQPIGRVGSTGTAATGPHLHISASKKPHVNLVGYDQLIDPITLFRH